VDVMDAQAALYTAAWADPAYRRACHGLTLWRTRPALFPERITSAIDLGCGTGRLVAAWRAENIEAYGVDLVAEASVDPTLRIAHPEWFTSSALEDFEPGRRYEVGVCADVLEHIAEDRVLAVLHRIRACCQMAVLLVANYPSAHAGQSLHPTLKTDYWWRTTLWAGLGGIVTPLQYERPGRAGQVYLYQWHAASA